MSTRTPVNKKHVAHLEKVRRQSMIIKYVTIGIFVMVGLLIIGGMIYNAGFPPYQYVARANGEALSAAEFKARVKIARKALINQYQQIYYYAQFFGVDPTTDQNFSGQLQQIVTQLDPTSKETVGQNVLNNWIEAVIIRAEAKKLGLTVSDEELDKTIKEEGFGFYTNGTPTPEPTATLYVEPTLNATQLAIVTITPTASPFPTATSGPSETPLPTATPDPAFTSTPELTATPDYTATPEPTATPYTLEGYNAKYKEVFDQYQSETGVTEEQFKLIFFIEPKLREKVQEAITADVKDTQEQVWARHILVATEDEAKTVLERVNNGEDWNAIAAEVSQDSSNKDKGGDLGWFAKGQMVKEFEDAAFSLGIGEISQPVQTQFGYHIIQVLGHEDRVLTADQVKQAKDQAFSEWLAARKEELKVTYYEFWKNIVPTEPTLGQ